MISLDGDAKTSAAHGCKPLERTIEQLLEAGMVICVESYVGAKGEREGVKLEQQVLLTNEGYDMLSSFPLEKELLD